MLILGVTGRFGGEYNPRTLSVSGSEYVWWRRVWTNPCPA